MRRLTDRDALAALMRALGKVSTAQTRVYFAGGATAVLFGWRASTIDVDLQLMPDRDELLRAIAALKDQLQINVEIAAPSHFIPELPGWETRSRFITREGAIDFYHYDFYAQALSKIERGHAQDRLDVIAMLDAGLVEPARLREFFDAIAPELYRYPALDPPSFRAAVDDAIQGRS